MTFPSLTAFLTALDEPPKRRGRAPREYGIARCTSCCRKPRFKDGAPVECECGAPALNPLAFVNLLPADFEWTAARCRRLHEMRFSQ
jgi:hypothetical protein